MKADGRDAAGASALEANNEKEENEAPMGGLVTATGSFEKAERWVVVDVMSDGVCFGRLNCPDASSPARFSILVGRGCPAIHALLSSTF